MLGQQPDVARWLSRPRTQERAHFTIEGELAELHRVPLSHVRVGDTASVRDGQGGTIMRCVGVTPVVRWEPDAPWTVERCEKILRTPGLLVVLWRAVPDVPRLLIGRRPRS